MSWRCANDDAAVFIVGRFLLLSKFIECECLILKRTGAKRITHHCQQKVTVVAD
jgi:hypothetical protein